MFGRMRPSSSSPDTLERPPSKVLKDDSFSIYEATLMKLKLGSQHDLSSPSEVAVEREQHSVSASVYALSSPWVEGMKIEPNRTSASVSPNEEVMTDVDDSAVSYSASSSDSQSTGVSNQQRSRNVSVLYLFSKYKSSKHALSSSHEGMMTENHGSFVSVSPSSSDCQSFSSTKEQSEEECASSLPVCQM